MPLIVVLAVVRFAVAVLFGIAQVVAYFETPDVPPPTPAYVLRLGPPPAVLRLDPPRGLPRTTPIFICDLADSSWVANTIDGARGGEVHAVPKPTMAEVNALFEEASANDPWVTDSLPPNFGPPLVWTVAASNRGDAGAAVQRRTRHASAEAIRREGERTTDRIVGFEDRRTAGALYAILMMTETGPMRNDCATPAGWPADPAERRRLLVGDDGIVSGKPAGRRFHLDLWFHHADVRNSGWCMALTDDPRWPRTDNPSTLVSVDQMRDLFKNALVEPDDLHAAASDVSMREDVNTWGEVLIYVHVPNSDNPRTVYDMKLTTAETRVLARSLAEVFSAGRPDLATKLRDVARDFPDHDEPFRRWED